MFFIGYYCRLPCTRFVLGHIDFKMLAAQPAKPGSLILSCYLDVKMSQDKPRTGESAIIEIKNTVWKYEESTQDRRLSASLLEKNTKQDTPAGQASCQYHCSWTRHCVERLEMWKRSRLQFLTERAEDEFKICTGLLLEDLWGDLFLVWCASFE